MWPRGKKLGHCWHVLGDKRIVGPFLTFLFNITTKYPTKTTWEGHIYYASEFRSILMGKAWQQKQEVAGHMAAAVRKQREINDDAQLTFPFHSVLDPNHRWCYSHSLVKVLRKHPHTHTGVSVVTLKPVKLTMRFNSPHPIPAPCFSLSHCLCPSLPLSPSQGTMRWTNLLCHVLPARLLHQALEQWNQPALAWNLWKQDSRQIFPSGKLLISGVWWQAES